MKYLMFSLILGFLALESCKKIPSEAEQTAMDLEVIEEYIAKNQLNAQSTASGLYYVINKQGTGTQPTSKDDVTVRYKGYFTDGKVFDQSSELGATFNLQNVIQGWTEGIPLFKEGGEGILIIPSRLGYGPHGKNPIPGGTVIVFDVKLLEVK